MARARSRFLVLLVAGGFLLASLGSASGHEFVDNTRLTIKKDHKNPYDRDEKVIFTGKANADHKFCRKFRVVKLFKQKPGPDRFIESDITGSRGRYKVVWVSGRVGTHRFYTRVTSKVGGQHPHRHVCLKDRSRTVKVKVKQLPG
jgi:hypothetical protein